jgi:hypothetical protein
VPCPLFHYVSPTFRSSRSHGGLDARKAWLAGPPPGRIVLLFSLQSYTSIQLLSCIAIHDANSGLYFRYIRLRNAAVPFQGGMLFVGGNCCALEPPARPLNRCVSDLHHRSVTSHGLHLPVALANSAPISSYMPAVYRGDDHITYSRQAQACARFPSIIITSPPTLFLFQY